MLALFPGSRENAYGDGAFLLRIVRAVARDAPALGAVFSIARGLDADRFARDAASDGWTVVRSGDDLLPFELRDGGRTLARAWRGPLGPILARAALVLGQAGTANEAAAAAGVPVVAFERDGDGKTTWYRKRQRGLLADALAVLPGDEASASAGVAALLRDPARRERMGAVGRERMGLAGGAARIARRIADAAEGR